VIDCGFDSLMHEREIISLGSQVTRAYSDNTRAQYQAHLYVSGWEPTTELRKRFDGLLKGVHANWRGIKFIHHDFVEAAAQARVDMASKHGGRMLAAFEKYSPCTKQASGHVGSAFAPADANDGDEAAESQRAECKPEAEEQEADAPSFSTGGSPSLKELQDQAEVIYLTSDSPCTLSELKPYHAYIIGGIVDKNRHKGICYKTALDANGKPETRAMLNGKEVKTAKLPIGDYMSMLSRQVLATNHVVEIMLRWLECGNWGQAFVEVMPKRKGAKLKNGDTHVEEQGQATEEVSNEEEAPESPGPALDIDL
jgi:tRNA (guanine9-N1)-methyltransferase